MSDKVFLDSNIFLYALDRHDRRKQRQAQALLLSAGNQHRIFISTQVLNEVYAAAVKKLEIDPVSAKEFVRGLYDFEVVLLTPSIIESAIDCSILHRVNYWDALMVAAAETSRCTELWTEDMQNGRTLRGVRIVDPFQKQ